MNLMQMIASNVIVGKMCLLCNHLWELYGIRFYILYFTFYFYFSNNKNGKKNK